MYRPGIRRILEVCSIIATCLWMEGVAFADPGDQGNQIYLGLGAGYGFEKFSGVGGLDFDDGLGFDVWGGYRLVPHVATEVQLEYLDGFNSSIGLDGQALAVTGNVKVFPLASLNDRVEPFLYAGIGVGWFEIDAGPLGDTEEADFIARFGGGADFYLSQNVALQVSSSYVLTTGDIDGLDWVSLVAGFQFRF